MTCWALRTHFLAAKQTKHKTKEESTRSAQEACFSRGFEGASTLLPSRNRHHSANFGPPWVKMFPESSLLLVRLVRSAAWMHSTRKSLKRPALAKLSLFVLKTTTRCCVSFIPRWDTTADEQRPNRNEAVQGYLNASRVVHGVFPCVP